MDFGNIYTSRKSKSSSPFMRFRVIHAFRDRQARPPPPWLSAHDRTATILSLRKAPPPIMVGLRHTAFRRSPLWERRRRSRVTRCHLWSFSGQRTGRVTLTDPAVGGKTLKLASAATGWSPVSDALPVLAAVESAVRRQGGAGIERFAFDDDAPPPVRRAGARRRHGVDIWQSAC
jgi:hypothetical protein